MMPSLADFQKLFARRSLTGQNQLEENCNMALVLKSNVCIIPAKGYSERIPRKNLQMVGDKPLIGHAVECAKVSELFDEIIVSTEDREVAEIARSFGARVPELRPDALAQNSSGVADVCIFELQRLLEREKTAFETLFLLLPTSPFRTPLHLLQAKNLFDAQPGVHALMSVSALDYPPQWAMAETRTGIVARMHPPEISHRRRHELTPTYRHDGLVAIFQTQALLERGNYAFPEFIMYPTPGNDGLDIDTFDDLDLARLRWERENGRQELVA
jgi:CMP-N-acetylneuraminic acid synthetase